MYYLEQYFIGLQFTFLFINGDNMIEKLACNLNRNDEKPNIDLAKELCSSEDKKGIAEIVQGLKSKYKLK